VLAAVFDDSVALLPEPADWLLMAIGIAAMVLVLQRQGLASSPAAHRP
jgi:high-affinity K+ transport system ATPase subunit B